MLGLLQNDVLLNSRQEIYMTEIEVMAIEFLLEYAQHTPPEQWIISPEIKEWIYELLMKLNKEMHL